MQYSLNYSGTRFFPLKINITQFSGGFRINILGPKYFLTGQLNGGSIIVVTDKLNRGDEWSLRAFVSMPSTAIFLRARAEIKNLFCELASNTKIWGAQASKHLFKFCEQIKQR